jgi:hypothetical protein
MPLTREGLFMAAVLACGEGAILSHDSAAVIQRLRKQGGTDPIHVSVPHDRRIRLQRIQAHRRNPMPPATTIGPLPLGQSLFTLIDRQLEQAAGYPGVGRLKATLARYINAGADRPRPHRLHWPDLGLVVETDGLTYHRTPMQQLEDRKRDQEHVAAGRTQIRIANVQIRESPAAVAAMLRRVMERLDA